MGSRGKIHFRLHSKFKVNLGCWTHWKKTEQQVKMEWTLFNILCNSKKRQRIMQSKEIKRTEVNFGHNKAKFKRNKEFGQNTH